ncbi:hypothetical protein AA23498_1188 [Acetobacter nitrogenifigens DSM 23921 = NBRC 105050]|uniref:Uncharacterized protein n=1 Tax=Acetobacter nitrogenifigens DSM 23921 = NBRC 105050 TaxID=1120919 RepID=A0A511XD26_9PROT|nr:hypothetical protein [Acetobacter nitrogenifigens]GBQ91469.1 hypothetical protein AA23498_1188 [Acetobacter nitrogenifigens DSM 23921 = NBRC 105050]GEN60863.1 hypothetical protein ANI02nite_27470 [Acetobacter nitrogenifigens DSM 23921 = NBRC 105050]
MTDSSFTKKKLKISFDIVDNGFNGGDETLDILGHRVSCQIENAAFESGVTCALRIEGMHLSDMNRLSTLQAGFVQQSQNSVTVLASDGGPYQAVFSDGVVEAFIDFSGAPNIAFVVMAQTMAIPAAMKISTTSFKDSVAVADIMKTIADKAGLTFQNNGVTQVLAGGVYYEGTAAMQMQAVAAATRITYCVAMNVLSIWPEQVKADSAQVEISADNGMMGYPAYSQYGVSVRTLFNSSIGFHTTIKLDSKYSPAAWVNNYGQLNGLSKTALHSPSNGVWVAIKVQHDLQSETPGGLWTTLIEAARPDFAGLVAYAV